MNLKEQAVELYLSGFPDDSKEFAKEFIENFFNTNCCYIEEDGKLISMLYMFDCEFSLFGEKQPVSYVYAVVTHNEYRGKGYMRRLMEKAKIKAKDKSALIIKPSNDELYSFYEKLGFKTAFYYSEKGYEKGVTVDTRIVFTDAEGYSAKREELLKTIPHICWDEMLEYIGLGGRFFIGEDFCGLAEITDDKVFLREFIGDKCGVDALLNSLSRDKATVRTSTPETPFGMICALKNNISFEKMYMGFAMD